MPPQIPPSTKAVAANPAAPVAPPSRSARTRERILRVSLSLFNDHGEGNVTTGHIADELNISPGNLYYHFRNKEEIIQHLFTDFERQIDIAPSEIAHIGHAMEDLWLYLHMMFERIWEYRFLYRNLDDLLARDAKLRSHFNIILTHKRDAVRMMCESLAAARALQATPPEIAALAENILVVATYWLNYENLKLRTGIRDDPEKHLTRGVYQVMALVYPYLVGDAREHLNHLMENYTA
jgi:AcrR family transcriptional regulator